MADVIADRLADRAESGRAAAAPCAAAVDHPRPPAKIGPNAILQLASVLRDEQHDRWRRDVFYRAGLSAMLVSPPEDMVAETAVADLYHALFDRLPAGAARRIAAEAGRRTARYILANRIPGPAQWLLRALPPSWAAPLLLRAIQRHAWTFAGSGEVGIALRPAMVIEIADNPISMPGCVWHVAVFETLFRHLVAPATRVGHPACCRNGARSCRFEISFGGGADKSER